MVALSVFFVTFAIAFGNYAHLRFLHWIWPSMFSVGVVSFLAKASRLFHFLVLFFGSIFFTLAVLGIRPFIQRRRFQRDLEASGLSNPQGIAPRIAHVIRLNENKTKLIVKSKGIGVDKFETKRGDLEFCFGQIVEGIAASSDRQSIHILLCKKELTKLIPFDDVVEEIKKPYSFVVGESASGVITQELRELPHLLIAGSTGGGKSAFFRQMLIGLLKSSPRLQLYLIDLKRGVEVKEFGQLPNVRVAKNEEEAVKVLKALNEEMHKRFAYLENGGFKKIDPERDKKDIIVLAIDEASVLYGKVSSKSSKASLTTEARELTDELSKLARAAGIHIVMATQKPVKDSLDTKTLENLTGRIAFKMSTHSGSNTALGNADAYALPDIKGRAIWSGGNKFIEVQTPFLKEEDLDDECKSIAETMSGNKQTSFGPMLKIVDTETSTDTGLQTASDGESAA